MSRVKVAGYGLAWNPQLQTGEITLQYEFGQKVKIPVKSAAEFTAMAIILNEEPVFLDDASGFIFTGLEAVGGS